MADFVDINGRIIEPELCVQPGNNEEANYGLMFPKDKKKIDNIPEPSTLETKGHTHTKANITDFSHNHNRNEVTDLDAHPLFMQLKNNVIGSKNNTTIIPVVLTKTLTAATGKICIKLPVFFDINTCLSFDIEVIDSNNFYKTTYKIVGQIYKSASNWANNTNVWCESNKESTFSDLTVRFGKDSTYTHPEITIGEDTTSWSYTYISIKNLICYFADYNLNSWVNGWDASIGKSTGTYSITIEHPNKLMNKPPKAHTHKATDIEISQTVIDAFKSIGFNENV